MTFKMPSAREVDDARPMSLLYQARSPEAVALAAVLDWTLFQATPAPGRTKIRNSYRTAISALVADLLLIEKDGPAAWGRRSLATGSFTELPFGHTKFKNVLTAAIANKLVRFKSGWTMREAAAFGGEGIVCRGAQSRIKAAPALTDLFAAHGLSPSDWETHYHLVRPKKLALPPALEGIVLRAGHRHVDGRRVAGQGMLVSPDDAAAQRLSDDLDRLNRFLFSQSIEGTVFRGLRRIFNDGDSPAFNWMAGGRHCCNGSPSYQSLSEAERLATIRINGEAVAEIDLRASHLTLLYGLTGTPMDASIDPYLVEGIPRDVVKMWLTQSLGAGGRGSQWARGSCATYRQANGTIVKLGRIFPYAAVTKAMHIRHPLLGSEAVKGWTSLRLQFVESEILGKAMDVLATRWSIPSLPMFDGLIVPISNIERASEVLTLSFEGQGKTSPYLKVSYGKAGDGSG